MAEVQCIYLVRCKRSVYANVSRFFNMSFFNNGPQNVISPQVSINCSGNVQPQSMQIFSVPKNIGSQQCLPVTFGGQVQNVQPQTCNFQLFGNGPRQFSVVSNGEAFVNTNPQFTISNPGIFQNVQHQFTGISCLPGQNFQILQAPSGLSVLINVSSLLNCQPQLANSQNLANLPKKKVKPTKSCVLSQTFQPNLPEIPTNPPEKVQPQSEQDLRVSSSQNVHRAESEICKNPSNNETPPFADEKSGLDRGLHYDHYNYVCKNAEKTR